MAPKPFFRENIIADTNDVMWDDPNKHQYFVASYDRRTIGSSRHLITSQEKIKPTIKSIEIILECVVPKTKVNGDTFPLIACICI